MHDRQFYAEWCRQHTFCHGCGVPAQAAPHHSYCGGQPLTTHHIIKPGRSDEDCNLLRMCCCCHSLAEGHQIRHDGVVLEKLALAVCLTIKKIRDPEHYNPTRLAELYRQALPDLQPIPSYQEELYRFFHPKDRQHFFFGL